MGLLRHDPTDATHTLHARTLIGRNPVCHVRVDDPRVSAEHASLSWSGHGWELRDLGSSNGTFVDGARVGPGESVALTLTSRFSFGQPGEGWRLLEMGAPAAWALELAGERRCAARGGLILLPDAESPEVCVYLDGAGHWICEAHDDVRQVADQAIVPAAGGVWRLYLPMLLAPTVREGGAASFELHFRVSSDEEYVELDVVQNGVRHAIGGRSFNYLLLVMARERLGEQDRAPTDQGWMHQEDLSQKLGIRDITVYTQIHRARQRLAEAGVLAAASLVERRHRTRQLRVGTASLYETRI